MPSGRSSVSVSDLRAMLRRYERAQGSADMAGLELARAIRDRIRYGGRGEQSACAKELGWSRSRMSDWLKVRAGRSEPALTGSKAARPAIEDASTENSLNLGAEIERERA
jgi:hypothetical protein